MLDTTKIPELNEKLNRWESRCVAAEKSHDMVLWRRNYHIIRGFISALRVLGYSVEYDADTEMWVVR